MGHLWFKAAVSSYQGKENHVANISSSLTGLKELLSQYNALACNTARTVLTDMYHALVFMNDSNFLNSISV